VSLRIEQLSVVYRDADHGLLALDGIDLELEPGRITALVGESGSGKTTLGKAIMRLLAENAQISGSILLDGRPVLGLCEPDFNALRWSRIAMVFQKGAASLNPVQCILDQVAEPLIVHQGLSRAQAREQAGRSLAELDLPAHLHERFPHELSGGQIQKALLAMALILDPEIVILDEPTAALDPMTRSFVAGIIDALRPRDKAVLLITHDLELADTLGDTIAVLYLGQVMELLPGGTMFDNPQHPYTLALGRSYPRAGAFKDLGGIRGDAFYRQLHTHPTGSESSHSHTVAPDSIHENGHAPSGGCLFYPRCTQAVEDCGRTPIALEAAGTQRLRCRRGGIISQLHIEGVSKRYGPVQALAPTDLTLQAGEVLCLVGETGSGKSTLAMIAAGVLSPDEGRRRFESRDMDQWFRHDYKSLARRIGVVYQNPAEAVSHRLCVADIVAEPLRIHNLPPGPSAVAARVAKLLAMVRLPASPEFLQRYPHELNLGAVQRVCLARALALSPGLLVADEPTSALDPSVQAKVLKMILDLQIENGLSLLFVTHDIGLARKIADRIAVMHAGTLVEIGPAAAVLGRPIHPYTRMLVNGTGKLFGMAGQGPFTPQSGCAFAPRCPEATEFCFHSAPQAVGSDPHRQAAACHLKAAR
jgi:peptide/nickel transport system ATP-binding protein